MNKLFKNITFMSAMTCGSFMISCQQQELSTLVQPAANDNEIVQAPPVMIPELKLSNFGKDSLIYDANGRLKRVLNIVGYLTLRTEYEYATNSVVAKYYENDQIEVTKQWTLENGRAVKLVRKYFHAPTVSGVSTMNVDYHYNNLNQLATLNTHDGYKSTITLSYDNLGNVAKVLFVNNTDQGDKFENLVKFDYTEYVGGPTEPAKGTINNLHVFGPHALDWIGDPYLPIFGKFGKNLVKKVIPTNSTQPCSYAYVLDDKGYVKEKNDLSKKGVIESTEQVKYFNPVSNR
ncbi:hypothetical protein MUK70_19760 [Dyadobacter chenwenxiniae]|uniref:YD repeat-containing protein n=1 Tax=Dyadobacter chenwenxiniae TaxID=2906456 RepID=A0A9X1PN25_9BACT|nr:hypothetical protein [Dyadobacter chenwenxiniae]MCF0061476.1 hypothetical protein [Dyadobacter chenwenxiniae]UON81299.1 hypothetical protein MUK70_19760 [Dyadobacter chenwenxiniae]